MPSIEFEVWCERCGAGLCNSCRTTKGGITIEPCESCMNEDRSEGYDEGYEDGYVTGYDTAKDEQPEE